MVYPADELTKGWILLVFDSVHIMVKMAYWKLQVLLSYIISIPLLLSENALFFIYYLCQFSTVSFGIALVALSVFSLCIGFMS